MNKINTVISDFNIPNKVYGDSDFTINPPTSNNSAAFSYASKNTSIARVINNNRISILNAGSCDIEVSQPEIGSNGLQFALYDGYYNDDVNYFTNRTPLSTGFVNSISNLDSGINNVDRPADNFSIQWLGYFRANSTGTWTFYTNSDDSSLLWIGSNAESSFTRSNATVDNGDTHSPRERSGTIFLTAGIFYPIRVQYGEQDGGETMTLSFEEPGFPRRRINGTNFFFNNLYTSASSTYTFTVLKADPDLSNFPDINKTRYVDSEPFTFSLQPPTSVSQSPFSYTSSNHSVATVSGNIVDVLSGGNSVITATQAASVNYNSSNISSTLFVSNICFPAGTLIKVDQGIIAIEKINHMIHTIDGKQILGITQSVSTYDFLICFEKHSLEKNIPSQKTLMTHGHGVFYNGKMRKAIEYIELSEHVYKTKYRGEILYNVLMEKHEKMKVNNILCETLNPENPIAKLFHMMKNFSPEEQKQIAKEYNEYIINNNKFTSKQLKVLNKCL